MTSERPPGPSQPAPNPPAPCGSDLPQPDLPGSRNRAPVQEAQGHSITRRRFLTGIGMGVGAGVAAGAVGASAVAAVAGRGGDASPGMVEFTGSHQAGIATPVQNHLNITAFDVTTRDRAQLQELLRVWTEMARQMVRGEDPPDAQGEFTVPTDSGDAVGLPAANLTLTFGVGPSLFDHRFGLASKRPRHLDPLPKFPGDQLRADMCGGDLVVQACADDPQVAVHAVRNLARAGFGIVAVRWSQLGFGRASSTSTAQETPRNLFGFKDGTNNLKAEDPAQLDRFVWVGDDEPQRWMHGGSYLCARRVRQLVEVWDRQVLGDQEATFGRAKASGAPLGAREEFDDVPLDLVIGRQPAIPRDSHVFLAHPRNNDGAQMLRRGYNFIEGADSFGHLSVGLYFIAFVNDPVQNFIPVQMNLSRHDKMNEYVRYESAVIFACPGGLGGPGSGDYWGRGLFED